MISPVNLRFAYFVAIFLLIIFSLAPAQIRFSGNSHVEYSRNGSKDVKQQTVERRHFFDNWTEGNWEYRRWRLGLRLEMHNAPPIYAPDQSVVKATLAHRFLEYHTGSFGLRVGNFYSLFGRGLTLRFYENRQLRHDDRADGVKIEYLHHRFDIKLIAGQPINRENQRQKFFQAAELKLKPFKPFQFGNTFVTMRPASQARVSWGSLFSELNVKFGSLYAEYAREDNPIAVQSGDALYLNSNLFLGAFSLMAEFKDYDRFEQFAGAFFNNPPMVAREHFYTLLNRRQLIQDADDEQGFLAEASYPIIKDGILTVNYNRTRNHRHEKKFQEYYGQFEWSTPWDWEWLGAFGRQEDPAARYLNFVNSASFKVSDFNALKIVYEHQHTKRLLNDQQFYDQAITLGFSHAPTWTVSLLGERTTEQHSPKRFWAALQLEVNFLKSCEWSLFAGSRRKGKVCVGGVCVIKPELDGIETTFTTRF
jgi:hypothetical protein